MSEHPRGTSPNQEKIEALRRVMLNGRRLVGIVSYRMEGDPQPARLLPGRIVPPSDGKGLAMFVGGTDPEQFGRTEVAYGHWRNTLDALREDCREANRICGRSRAVDDIDIFRSEVLSANQDKNGRPYFNREDYAHHLPDVEGVEGCTVPIRVPASVKDMDAAFVWIEQEIERLSEADSATRGVGHGNADDPAKLASEAKRASGKGKSGRTPGRPATMRAAAKDIIAKDRLKDGNEWTYLSSLYPGTTPDGLRHAVKREQKRSGQI